MEKVNTIAIKKKATFKLEKKWFIDSNSGNIKDEYKFTKKLG